MQCAICIIANLQDLHEMYTEFQLFGYNPPPSVIKQAAANPTCQGYYMAL